MNIFQIDLRLLRSFLTVAKAGNFVRGAQALSITQSALSQQMKELSSHLDLKLFEKRGRRLILTKYGDSLVQRIEPLIGKIEEALLQIAHETQNIVGTLRIGATNTYSKTIALPASIELLKLNPSLKIDLKELPAQRVLIELMAGEIDIAILPEDYQLTELEWKRLLTERLSVIGDAQIIDALPKKIILKSLAKHELVTLNRQFLIRQKLDSQARKENVSLNIRMEVSTMGDLLEIAKSGRFLVVGSPIALIDNKKLKSKVIEGEFLTRTAAICWRKTKFVTSAMKAFEESAIKISSSLQVEIKKEKAQHSGTFS